MCTNHETTGKWVVVVNDYEGPEGEEHLRQTLSYGFFDSQEEAIQYGVDHKFVERYGYFHVPEVLTKEDGWTYKRGEVMKYRENMTADELAKFMQKVNELDAAYKDADKIDREVAASSPMPEEYEDPSDYAGMGWVDSRGRP